MELVPPPMLKMRPNGKKDLQQTEIFRSLRNTGMSFLEVVLDVENESRAFVISPEGHEPTKYEMSQISHEDWERLRNSVDLWGTQRFSDRVTLLETRRGAFEPVPAQP